ncbi:MAG: NAD-dependent deacetylase, partial [Chloroflexi bacterium]|nr:NAD-dependent deacetylase [Chloroflexota bacterium]
MLFEDNIAHAADLIINATRVVALTGAGISTPSGIPDFRSPGSGLWEKADPFVVASLEGFLRNPNAFYDWIKPLIQITR